MQADLFSPVKLVMLVAVAVSGGLCIAGAVLALLSPTWRSRLGRVALHALWIIPVAGLFFAALSWRVHHARSQAVPTITWTTPTSLTVPETPWPPAEASITLPRTETFQVPTTTIRYSLLRGGLIALTGVAVMLTIGWSVMRHRRHQTTPMIQVAGVAAALAILGTGVLGAFLVMDQREAELRLARQQELRAIGDAMQQQRARLHVQQSITAGGMRPSQVLDYRGKPVVEQPVQAAPAAESPDNSPATEIVAYVGSIPTGQRLTELPAWVTEKLDGDDSLTRTYSSGLWVTTEEADQELLRKVAPEVQQFFWSEYPAAAGWSPTPELIVPSGAVARRCYETVPVQFGEHTQTMHKAHWQVAHRPEVARFLFDNWRPLAVRQRLIWAGVGVGLLTLIFGSLGAYYRLNAATAGRYRGRLRFATGAVCVAGGLAAILLS